jgi:hypothetical protein
MATDDRSFEREDEIARHPPSPLFKFRDFPSLAGLSDGRLEVAKWQREEVFQIFRGVLRLAKPDSFNDPFEFRPAVTLVGGTTSEQERSSRRYVRGAMRERLPFKERVKYLENPEKLKRVTERLPEITAQSLQNMRNEVELYCLTATETRPLLWSHYASGHRGVAIHFDATKPPFNLTWEVRYTRVYPTVEAGGERSVDENWRRLSQSLLIKDEDWAYEHEYRFLAPQTKKAVQMLNRRGVKHEGGFLHIDPRLVVGVTLGAKMPQDARDDLLEFLRANRPDVGVRHARLATDRFEVEIE